MGRKNRRDGRLYTEFKGRRGEEREEEEEWTCNSVLIKEEKNEV